MDPIQCFGGEKLEPELDVEESSFLGPFKHPPPIYFLSVLHLNEKKKQKQKLYAHLERSLPAELSGPQVSQSEPVNLIP